MTDNPLSLRDLPDALHVRRLPVEVDGNDEACSLGDGRFDQGGIEVVVLLAGVDGHGDPPACRTAANVATNVFPGTMTSSPCSISAARRPSRRASRPLDIPTQCATPQYAANCSSNSVTCGP